MMLLPFDDLPPSPNKPASNMPYVVAVILIMAFGTIAILVLTALRPAVDNTLLIAAVVGFLTPTTLSLLALMKSQETHLSVNSQLAAFIANAKQVGHLEGKEEGRSAGIIEGQLRHAVIPVVDEGRSAGIAESQPRHAVIPVVEFRPPDPKAPNG